MKHGSFNRAKGVARLIDGEVFTSTRIIFGIAKKKGYTGCYETLEARLQAGADTWAKLIAPVNETSSRNIKRRNQQSKDEVQAAIAALDARKRALTAGQKTD